MNTNISFQLFVILLIFFKFSRQASTPLDETRWSNWRRGGKRLQVSKICFAASLFAEERISGSTHWRWTIQVPNLHLTIGSVFFWAKFSPSNNVLGLCQILKQSYITPLVLLRPKRSQPATSNRAIDTALVGNWALTRALLPPESVSIYIMPNTQELCDINIIACWQLGPPSK